MRARIVPAASSIQAQNWPCAPCSPSGTSIRSTCSADSSLVKANSGTAAASARIQVTSPSRQVCTGAASRGRSTAGWLPVTCASTREVPTIGCPASRISAVGLKIRTSAPSSSTASTNTVSLKPSRTVSPTPSSPESPAASSTTPSSLPYRPCSSEKTRTTCTFMVMAEKLKGRSGPAASANPGRVDRLHRRRLVA